MEMAFGIFFCKLGQIFLLDNLRGKNAVLWTRGQKKKGKKL